MRMNTFITAAQPWRTERTVPQRRRSDDHGASLSYHLLSHGFMDFVVIAYEP